MTQKMSVRSAAALIAILAWSSSRAWAQDSTTTTSSASSAVTSATSSPQAQQITSIWGLIGKIPAACKQLKACFCKSCCGQLVSTILKPLSMATGGCIKCCPDTPAGDDALKSPAGAACAAIQKDTMEAKDRIALVRCLAAVDCNYWPEAEKGLIDTLRADKLAEVRFAAAIALGDGCCCTPKTIAALKLTVARSTADGNPAETSPRVIAAAERSLQICLQKCPEATTLPPERPVPPEKPAVRPRGATGAGAPVGLSRTPAPVIVATERRAEASENRIPVAVGKLRAADGPALSDEMKSNVIVYLDDEEPAAKPQNPSAESEASNVAADLPVRGERSIFGAWRFASKSRRGRQAQAEATAPKTAPLPSAQLDGPVLSNAASIETTAPRSKQSQEESTKPGIIQSLFTRRRG